jgi:hypothetical protein
VSDSVGTAAAKSFEGAITLEPQQEEARLWPRGQHKNVESAEEAFFDRVDTVSASKKLSRHQPTVQSDTPHTRRRAEPFTYTWADFIDGSDLRRMKISPQNSYVKSARNAHNRAMDEEFILQATATAKTGKAGAGTELYPAGQTIGTSGTVMSTDLVLQANEILDAAEHSRSQRYMAASAYARRTLMTEDTGSEMQFAPVASADFGDKRVLAVGTIGFYGGFEWIPSQLLAIDSGDVRSNLAWQKEAMGLVQLKGVSVDIGPRRDLSNTMQIFVESDFGATRVVETGVVEILVDET